jgi:acyl-CoA dehydrogenase
MQPSVYLTPEHELLSDQVLRFVADEVEPVAAQWEAQGYVPREVLRRMGSLGFFGLMYDPQFGGAGADPLTNLVFAESLSQSTFGGFIVTVLVHTDMASPHLHHAGNAEQLQRWMPKIVSGETITAVAVTEPGAGSDVAGIRTRAVRDGDHFVLNGTKMFITNGVHADLYFVAAKTGGAPAAGGKAKGSGAISMFAVEKGTPGFRVGRALDKSGWLSSDTAELVFEDCRVPAGNLLGRENDGFYSIMKNFQNERLMCGAVAIGHADRAIAMTLEHVKTRRAFGATLWDKQAIRQRLAMLQAKTEALRALTYHCAWLMKEQRDCVREISGLKALGGELVNEVLYTCQQFHGGMGYMRGTAIERLWRDARILAIGGGATEVMLEEVAKRL